jgi:hypothetical protein
MKRFLMAAALLVGAGVAGAGGISSSTQISSRFRYFSAQSNPYPFCLRSREVYAGLRASKRKSRTHNSSTVTPEACAAARARKPTTQALPPNHGHRCRFIG